MPKSTRVYATQPSGSPALRRIFRSIRPAAANFWSSRWVRPRQRTTAMRRHVSFVLLLAMLAVRPIGAIAAESASLRICADPNNLPFSNRAGEGFENKLAEMVAQRFGKAVVYTWWAQRRGFIRHTLKAGDCDLVMGVPAQYDLVETTRPYYQSTYAFVSQTERN